MAEQKQSLVRQLFRAALIIVLFIMLLALAVEFLTHGPEMFGPGCPQPEDFCKQDTDCAAEPDVRSNVKGCRGEPCDFVPECKVLNKKACVFAPQDARTCLVPDSIRCINNRCKAE